MTTVLAREIIHAGQKSTEQGVARRSALDRQRRLGGDQAHTSSRSCGALYCSIFPGLAIFVTMLALNIVGYVMRDTLDPRLRGKLGDERR